MNLSDVEYRENIDPLSMNTAKTLARPKRKGA